MRRAVVPYGPLARGSLGVRKRAWWARADVTAAICALADDLATAPTPALAKAVGKLSDALGELDSLLTGKARPGRTPEQVVQATPPRGRLTARSR